MKYLFFLLFPTLSFAESFFLICDGSLETYVKELGRGITDETVTITVNEKDIKYEDRVFSNYQSPFRKENYDLTKDKIFFNSRNVDENKKITGEVRAVIDRVSGKIEVREAYKYDNHNTKAYFSGTCRKASERAF